MKLAPEEGDDREEACGLVVQAERVETGEKVFVLEPISPTFYEQLLHHFPFAEKIQT